MDGHTRVIDEIYAFVSTNPKWVEADVLKDYMEILIAYAEDVYKALQGNEPITYQEATV